jgi:hypothetical protein
VVRCPSLDKDSKFNYVRHLNNSNCSWNFVLGWRRNSSRKDLDSNGGLSSVATNRRFPLHRHRRPPDANGDENDPG